MAQPYPDVPDVRPSKNRARTARRGPCLVVETKETGAGTQSASSREDYAATTHPGAAKPVHCTRWWRLQPSGHLIPPTHRAKWGFCTTRSLPAACRQRVAPLMLQFPPLQPPLEPRQNLENRPNAPQPPDTAHASPSRTHRPARPRKWGFGSTRSPVTACRRRVAPLMLQFPPAFHIRAVETSCNTQPGPLLVTPRENTAPLPALHRTARERLSDQTQLEDANCNELSALALKFTHEPRSQGQRRSLHPQRR